MPHFLNFNCIQNTQVTNLIKNNFLLHEHGSFMIVRFYTANKMEVAFSQIAHQVYHLFTIFGWEKLFRLLRLFFINIPGERYSVSSLRFLFFLNEEIFETFQFGGFHDIFNLISEKIFVFLSKTNNRVINLFGSMFDFEKSWRKIEVGLREILMFFMVKSKFSDERWFIGRSHWTPLIKKIEDTESIVINKLNYFEVVREIDLPILTGKSLLFKYLSFLFENSVQINLMQSFICIVNEKLLQTVRL